MPDPGVASGSRLSTARTTVRSTASGMPSRRRVGPGRSGNREPGTLGRLRLGLDRPVADAGQIEDRQLHDQHQEHELDHFQKCKQS
jgi:hypothetical protein